MSLSANFIIMIATIASVVGAISLYFLGRLVGIDGLEKINVKYGKLLKVTKEDIERANSWFQKYGMYTVLFCRLVPLVRTIISIPAGITKMNFFLFLVLTTIGHFIWNSILVNTAVAFTSLWREMIRETSIYAYLMHIFIIIAIILVIIFSGKVKRKLVSLRNEP